MLEHGTSPVKSYIKPDLSPDTRTIGKPDLSPGTRSYIKHDLSPGNRSIAKSDQSGTKTNMKPDLSPDSHQKPLHYQQYYKEGEKIIKFYYLNIPLLGIVHDNWGI